MSNHKNNAKFAFFYMLSLVALVFMALGTGQVAFQIINKLIPEVTVYSNSFDSSMLKFAISALIISIPLYFLTMRQIEKNLESGELDRESAIRRWLTYFIIFVSSVVAIVWLMMTIGSFLDGELTSKFILKAATALIISGSIFGYYLYDIRRASIKKDDIVVRVYWIAALAIAVAALAAAFFFAETPAEARARRHDIAILDNFSQIDSSISNFYTQKGKLPAKLDELRDSATYINFSAMKDPVTGKAYEYKRLDDSSYELCSDFMTDNRDQSADSPNYSYSDRWPHATGYQCLRQKAVNYNEGAQKPAPAR